MCSRVKIKVKIILDISMLLLFLLQMAYHLIGNTLHERLGMALVSYDNEFPTADILFYHDGQCHSAFFDTICFFTSASHNVWAEATHDVHVMEFCISISSCGASLEHGGCSDKKTRKTAMAMVVNCCQIFCAVYIGLWTVLVSGKKNTSAHVFVD